MHELTVRPLSVNELHKLTDLFHYNDVQAMIDDTAQSIEQRRTDVFGLFKGTRLIGELHAMYQCEETDKVIPGKRAYLYAFRVHKKYQGQGFGNYLLKKVVDIIAEKGYSELTVGVEDDNERAIYMYEKFGFNELIARKYEEYQGDGYEYNLYMKRITKNQREEDI